MSIETNTQLIRVHLQNIENAYKLYREQIEMLLQRIEGEHDRENR